MSQTPVAAFSTTGPRRTEHRPSVSLLQNFRQELVSHSPFAQMTHEAVDFFLTHAEQVYYAPDDIVLQPAMGVVKQLFYIRKGAVTGVRGLAEQAGGTIEYQAGDLFPVSAAVAGRPVTATYRACADTFVLELGVADMQALAQLSPTFTEFLNSRTTMFLELSRKAIQAAYSAQSSAEQTLERSLGDLVSAAPVTCAPETPLRQALQQMHQKRIGSILVTDPVGTPMGILTRYDVLGRITLAQVSLDSPISQVMVSPVYTLTEQHCAQDAALLMSRHGMRHVPVTRGGVAVGMVSERDLFALQKQSLKSISSAIRAASDVQALKLLAPDLRRLAGNLLAQGVGARQLTALISHLNDLLTEQLLKLKAAEHGLNLNRFCWLSLGSEGREEQTIATDQDNVLIMPDDTPDELRELIRAFAQEVNQALADCGYPLCKGGIMAGEPTCCLTLTQWRERFRHWIAHGSPQDLLNASIYFDFRSLAGDRSLAEDLRREVTAAARSTPRFLKQMAINALTRCAPLNWRGAIDTDDLGSIDLKLQGTAIFVDTARLYSLAYGIDLCNTQKRLEAIGQLMNLPSTEFGAWVGGFEFLQILRLRLQLESQYPLDHPNRIVVAQLNDIDRRILRESFRVARQLQQRLQLDYQR